MSRNTEELNKVIYDTLKGDAPLVALLGDISKVRHASPQNLSEYPLVTYKILDEQDNEYDADTPCDITGTYFLIQSFSANVSTKEVDALDDRVYAILHGKSLSNSAVLVYTAYRQSKRPDYEPEVKVQRVDSLYKLVNVIKP